MTTKRTYFCNLCRDEIGDGKRHGHGFRFSNARADGQTMTVLEDESLHNAENHICDPCLQACKRWKSAKR